MIEPELRNEHVARALADPDVAVLLVDVVLGYGSHPDPAGVLVKENLAAKAVVASSGRHGGRPAGALAPSGAAACGRRGGRSVERDGRRAGGGARRLVRRPRYRDDSGECIPPRGMADAIEPGEARMKVGNLPRRQVFQQLVQRFMHLPGGGGGEVRRADLARVTGEPPLRPAP